LPRLLHPLNNYQKTVLATFNRSGSSWLRYCIEKLANVYSNADYTEEFKDFFAFAAEVGLKEFAPDN
jgi:predicted ATP-grasp superfamily ATP-dependent carboligase